MGLEFELLFSDSVSQHVIFFFMLFDVYEMFFSCVFISTLFRGLFVFFFFFTEYKAFSHFKYMLLCSSPVYF